MTTTSLHISLSEQLKNDVRTQVEEGRYSNPTDYVRHLIRKDILRKKARLEFAAFIREGMHSPNSGQTPGEMIAEIKQEIEHMG
jgi:antitoxin ParD1/3/4